MSKNYICEVFFFKKTHLDFSKKMYLWPLLTHRAAQKHSDETKLVTYSVSFCGE